MKNDSPIFVVGCPRSGTTLLRKVLNSHSNIACPPESKFIVQLVNLLEVDQARNGLLSIGCEVHEIQKRLRRFIDSFFQDYCQKQGKKRWADKTPHHVFHLETIDNIFEQQALWIAITRNVVDVANSLQHFNWGILNPFLEEGTPKVISAIRLWSSINQKILNFSASISNRIYFIKYEDLTSSPEETLKFLFKFLNEPYQDQIINYGNFDHGEGYGDVKSNQFDKIRHKISKSEKTLDPAMEKRLITESKCIMEKLGYLD